MAAEWLGELLATGPMPRRDIAAEAKDAGLSWATVRRAADDLGITAVKTGFDGGWAWRLPDEGGEEIEL
jgi:putative DNA primase/helicase